MEYEMEITERLREGIITILNNEMLLGWSLDQLMPMFYNAIEDALEEMEGK